MSTCLAEAPFTYSSGDRVGVGALAGGGFADLGGEFLEIRRCFVECILAFELGAECDLQELGRRQPASLQLIMEIIRQIHLKARHTPNCTPIDCPRATRRKHRGLPQTPGARALPGCLPLASSLCEHDRVSDRAAELELLLRLGDLADEIAIGSWRSSGLSTRGKPDGSPVTAVDVDVERRLRDCVLGMHPRDGFMSEELGMSAGTSGRCWYVDGIDGTTAYADSRPEWSTLIALTDSSGLHHGLCAAPALGKRWYVDADSRAVATDSSGSTRRVQVSRASRGPAARIACWPPAQRIGDHLSSHGRSRLEVLTAGRSTRRTGGASTTSRERP